MAASAVGHIGLPLWLILFVISNQRPKIVLISSPRGHFSPLGSGAISTWLYEVSRVAQSDGFEPIVVARAAPQPPYEGISAHFVDYPRVPTSALAVKWARGARKIDGWPHFGQRIYAARVAALLQREKLHDFPIVINNDPELAVYLQARFPKAQIIAHFQNQLTMRPRWKARFSAAKLGITAVSDFTRRWLAREYSLSADEMHTVYNGVDLNSFQPAATELEGLPVLNFVGRTGREKAPDTLLQAALQLRESGCEFGLQLIGSNHWGRLQIDDYQRELNALVEVLEARGVAVRRPGHIDRFEVPAQFQRAHIHVVPSRWEEPFGLTTVEGMASGLATLASNTGGSPEIIAEAGFLFERDSPTNLAAKLRPLLQDPELRRHYGQLARARSLEFSWRNTWRSLRVAARL